MTSLIESESESDRERERDLIAEALSAGLRLLSRQLILLPQLLRRVERLF